MSGGEPVDNENSAYALASCDGCTTLAVSFQLVLVVGQSDRIMPINVAEALNLDCPACITTAIAKQIVVSVTSAPSEELLRRLTAELQKLDAIDTNDSPAEVLAQVNAVTDDDPARARRERDHLPEGHADACGDHGGERDPRVHREPQDDTHAVANLEPGADGELDPGTDGDRHADADPTPTATPTPTGTPTPTATPTPTP